MATSGKFKITKDPLCVRTPYGTSYTSIFCLLKQPHVEARREAIIRALMEFLGESSGELIKDYKVNSNIFRSQCSLEYTKLYS